MRLPRTTTLQREILFGLDRGHAVHPVEYGSSDLENAISGDLIRTMNTRLKATTVYSLENKGLIDIEFHYELGKCYPQVQITEIGRQVANRYRQQSEKS